MTLAHMFGVLRLSRALADRRLADVLLDQGIQDALTLLGLERPRDAGVERPGVGVP
jgi:hypothetical protein